MQLKKLICEWLFQVSDGQIRQFIWDIKCERGSSWASFLATDFIEENELPSSYEKYAERIIAAL